MFAKLFETEEYGQVLAKFDDNESGNPEIRVYIQPKDMGVCSLAASADNDEPETYDALKEVFEKFTLDYALELINPLLRATGILAGEEK